MAQLVIDVSEHNGTIDWEKVRDAGYHAIIRLGYGQPLANQRDLYALRNVSECERLGIPYGLYLYSYANTRAKCKGEAEHAVSFARSHAGKNMLYPIFYDVEEERSDYYAVAAANCDEFCSIVEEAGYLAGVYANEAWYKTHLKGMSSRWKRWVAKWSSKAPDVSDVAIWQYTSDGSCPGVKGRVDVNRSYMVVGEGTGSGTDSPRPSGEFSSIVRDLQSACNSQGFSNQAVDGIAGPVTLAGCPTVRMGARGEITRCIQRLLSYHGINLASYGADGIYGSETGSAVRRFQLEHHLSVDGIVGPNTWARLLDI